MQCPGTALWPVGASGFTTNIVMGTCPKCGTEQKVHLDGGMVFHRVPEPPVTKAEILERFVVD